MGKIGSFGGVTFEVSTKKVLTFDDFSRSGEARWSEHEVKGKPISEFIGPGQESASLTILLNKHWGTDPVKELNKLRSFRDKGKTGAFIIGNKSISSNHWYIASIGESDYQVDAKGRFIGIKVDLSLREYAKDVKAISISKPKPKPKPKKKKAPASKRKVIGTITIKVGMLNCRASRSLKGRILKVLRKGQKYKVYGKTTTDIPWYDLGGGKYTSAVSKYTSFKKG